MKPISYGLGIVLMCVMSSAAIAGVSPAGTWRSIDDDGKTEKALIRIDDNAGVLRGTLVQVLTPGVSKTAKCIKCLGALQDAPLQGLPIIEGVRQDKSLVWSGGQILDPSSGKTYKVRMTLSDDGSVMEVRGYVGIPALGRTQVWHRQP